MLEALFILALLYYASRPKTVEQRSAVTQRQLPPYEVGAAICCDARRCVMGPLSVGTRTRVDVKLSCPVGMRPVGIIHTHPGGALYPSQMDIENLRRAGLRVSCIVNERGARCFFIDKLGGKRL